MLAPPMAYQMVMDTSSLRDLDWDQHWDNKLDLQWEAHMKEWQAWIRQ